MLGRFLPPDQEDQRAELYGQKFDDASIAMVCGVTRSAIAGWRKRRGLRSHIKAGANLTHAYLRLFGMLVHAGADIETLRQLTRRSRNTVRSWRKSRPDFIQVTLKDFRQLKRGAREWLSKQRELKETIIAHYLLNPGPKRAGTIARLVGVSSQRAYRLLEQLVAEGKLYHTSDVWHNGNKCKKWHISSKAIIQRLAAEAAEIGRREGLKGRHRYTFTDLTEGLERAAMVEAEAEELVQPSPWALLTLNERLVLHSLANGAALEGSHTFSNFYTAYVLTCGRLGASWITFSGFRHALDKLNSLGLAKIDVLEAGAWGKKASVRITATLNRPASELHDVILTQIRERADGALMIKTDEPRQHLTAPLSTIPQDLNRQSR